MAVQFNIGNYNNHVSFKSLDTNNSDKVQDKIKYTNYGLKTGSMALAGVTLLSLAFNYKNNNFAKMALKTLKNAPMYLGCGAIVDYVINKHKSAFNESIKGKDYKEVFSTNKKATMTPKGNIYYNTNDGKKYGTLLGLAAGLINSLAIKNGRKYFLLPALLVSTIGGRALGSLTDHFTNKNSIKQQDING